MSSHFLKLRTLSLDYKLKANVVEISFQIDLNIDLLCTYEIRDSFSSIFRQFTFHSS